MDFNPTFAEIDTARKTPSNQAEINDSTAIGLPSTAKKILLLAPYLSGGTSSDGVLTQGVVSQDEVGGLCGVIAERMAAKVFAANPTAQMDVLAIAEAGGSAAAAGSIVFATNADVDGAMRVYVGDHYVDVAITSGMTPTQIGDALVAAWTADALSPVSGVNTTGSVAHTYKAKSTLGNSVRTVVEMPDGIATTATVTQLTSGSGDPTVSAAYTAAYKDRNYDLIVVPWKWLTTNLTALKNAAIYMAHAARGYGAMHVVGLKDTYANAVTYAAAINRRDFVVVLSKSTSYWLMPPHERAAYEAGVLSAEADPSVPFIRDPRPEVLAPIETTSTAPTAAEIEGCMNNGVTIDVLREDGSVEVVQTITTATTLSGGAASDAWASPHVWFVAKYLRTALLNRLAAVYSTRASRKMTPGKLGDIKGQCLALLYQLAAPDVQYLSKDSLDENLAGIVVRQNATNSKFIDIGLPAPIIPEFRGVNAALYLTIPALAE